MVRVAKIVAGTLVGVLLLSAAATGIGEVLINRANPPEGQFIDTTSGRQHVLAVGPDDAAAAPGAAVVLMHGAGANLADMRLALVDRLRARYRVIAIDRPGHGWSERAGGIAEASPRRQAAVVHEILGKLGVKRPVMLGHSWSGALAAAYALDYPDDLRGLVLLAPAVYPLHRTIPWYFEAGNMPGVGVLLAHTLALPFGYLTMDRLVDRVFSPQRPPPGYIARASIPLALRPSAFLADSEDLSLLAATFSAQSSDYPRIRTPTIIITGSDDRVLSPRVQSHTVAAQIPQAKLVTLPGVGHMLHHESPERVVAAVEQLMQHEDRVRERPAAIRQQ